TPGKAEAQTGKGEAKASLFFCVNERGVAYSPPSFRGECMAASFRTDWRLISLMPAASFGLALVLGFLCWYFLMLQASPYFGNPQLGRSAGLRSALGVVIAGKHM